MKLWNTINGLIRRFLRSLFLIFAICLIWEYTLADQGVIVYMTRKCFVIETTMGYVIVGGWVNASKGTVVTGDFNKYGSTKIFDATGRDISGYIYIEDWGLSKSRLQEKWQNKYADKCE